MRIIGSHRRLHRRVKLKVRQVGQPTKNKWQYHTNITMKRCACESRQNEASIFCHKWICCEIRNGHCEYKHTRHSNWAQNLPVQTKGSTLWFQRDTHQHFYCESLKCNTICTHLEHDGTLCTISMQILCVLDTQTRLWAPRTNLRPKPCVLFH